MLFISRRRHVRTCFSCGCSCRFHDLYFVVVDGHGMKNSEEEKQPFVVVVLLCSR